MDEYIDIRKYVPQGKRHSQTECPLALAIRDAYYADKVEVDGTEARVYKDGEVEEFNIGDSLSDSIKHFDATGEWPEAEHKGKFHVVEPVEAMLEGVKQGTYKRA